MKKELATFATELSRLAADAPEGDGQDHPVQTPPAPAYVREAWGWGSRYVAQIELRGEKWHEAFEIAKPIAASGGILVFAGDRGPGKTRMAAELARSGDWPHDRDEYTRADGLKTHRSKTALYVRAMDIFLELREAQKNHVKSSERAVLDRLAKVGFLAIDEFQERGETPFEDRMMKNLVDKRYSDQRTTILIANMGLADFFASLGSTIVDRGRENGRSISFDWPSFRRKSPES